MNIDNKYYIIDFIFKYKTFINISRYIKHLYI